MNEKQLLEDLKVSILGQLKVLRLIKNNDKNFTLSVPIVKGANIGSDEIISILNKIYEPQQVPEIISIQEFRCTDTNSTILFTLRK